MQGIFHLAIPSHNLEKSKKFYTYFLNCKIGRENKGAIIFNFFQHQVILHKTENKPVLPPSVYPHHFGFIFHSFKEWDLLLQGLKEKNAPFYQTEKLRHTGLETEHHTFFLQDPNYNLLEFKFYKNSNSIFKTGLESKIGDIP